MKRSNYTEEQIICLVKRLEQGMKLSELSRETGISDKTLSRWKSKYAGLEVREARRLKQLEEENRRLKKLVAEKELDIQILNEVLGKL